jgi:hypothetical protein
MRSPKYLESDEVILNKWGYAMFAGVIGMAMAYDSGGFSLLLGFALGFFGVLFGLIGLELWGQRIRLSRQLKREVKGVPDNTPANQQVQAR